MRRKNLEKILKNKGILWETQKPQDVHEVARECKEKNVGIIAVSGGDGSNHYAMTAIHKAYEGQPMPLVAGLRGGTMNLLEESLGMKGTPEQRLQKLIYTVNQGRLPVVSHTLLKVNDKFGWIFANGLFSNFLEEYYKGTPSFGHAVRMFLKGAWAVLTGQEYGRYLFRPVHATVQIGETTLPKTSFNALIAATERECGLGFKPFYRAREEQGKFHFLACNFKPLDVLQNLPQIHRGKKLQSGEVYDVVTNDVYIETFEPYHYTIDGEMLNSTKQIRLSSGPVIDLVAI